MTVERCICCGEIIPEGRQVCHNCANDQMYRNGTGRQTMCNKCDHRAVCGKFRATGGVKKCEQFKENARCDTCEWYRGTDVRFCDHPTDGMSYPAADDFCSYYAPREEDEGNC